LELPSVRVYPDLFAIGYVRVSTGKQAAADKVSLPLQIQAVTALSEKKGTTLDPYFVIIDPGKSGRTAERRPGFMRLEALCKANPRSPDKPGHLYFLSDDRFGRFFEPEDATYWRVHFRKLYGWIVFFSENDETNDPLARGIIRTIGAASASSYSNDLSTRARSSKRAVAEMGLWNGPAPFGYRRSVTRLGEQSCVLEAGQSKATDQRARLTLGPADEVALVRSFFQRYAEGTASLTKLALEVDSNKKWAHKLEWSPQRIAKMLRSGTYLGCVPYGDRPVENGGLQRRHTEAPVRIKRTDSPPKHKDEEMASLPFVWVEESHPAIVSEELFARVQERLGRNARITRAVAGTYPFSGLFTCSTCGETYTGGGGPKNHRDPTDPHRYRFYKCNGGVGIRPTCPGFIGTLQKRLIEPMIVEAIGRVVASDIVQQAIAAAIDRALEALQPAPRQSLASVKRQSAALEKQKQRLLDCVQQGAVGMDDISDRLSDIRRQLSVLSEARESVTSFDAAQAGSLKSVRTSLLAQARDFPALAATLTGAELRELCSPWIATGVVDKHRRTLTIQVRRVPTGNAFLHLEHSPGPDSR
jgi:DNA invertase Pin-like site-specific DNA recombinase